MDLLKYVNELPVVLAILVCLLVVAKVVRDFQVVQGNAEVERRVWQAAQDAKREKGWQDFIERFSRDLSKDIDENTSALGKLIEAVSRVVEITEKNSQCIQNISRILAEHDTRAQNIYDVVDDLLESGAQVKKPTRKITKKE